MEAPHTIFYDSPKEFDVLNRGISDLGFENLGLDEREFKRLYMGFAGAGLAVPGTQMKIRARSHGSAVWEPREPGEELPELPEHWMEGVLVIDRDGQETIYAGERVRREQTLG